MDKKRVRVALYELNDLMRMGLRCSLGKYDDLDLLADLASFDDLLQITSDLLPDILIIDFNSLYKPMESINLLRQESPNIKILLLVNDLCREDFCTYIRNKIEGIIEKDSDSAKIHSSILSIVSGVRAYSDSLITDIYQNLFETEIESYTGNNMGLSTREAEVLELIVNGRSNDQISKELFISLATTKTHVRNILSKLNVEDRTQAAVKALRVGLFDLNEREREEQLI
ncbi:MAG: response regulator transcription factor [Candidatus Caenarcaniphilales bacterium]|nr:response regulator transcription factor [Candidatus Caenarcaniphilales bacterium]